MEQNFQTSFIPKKPMLETRTTSAKPISVLVTLGIFVLVAMVVATAGLYIYKGILTKNITQMESNLNLAKNRFEPAKITQLQVLNKRLDAASEILSKHISISPIFQELQKITMKTVRFTDFSYSVGTDKESKITVKMKGQAIGYRSVALESDLFTADKNFIDPIFSNLNLDDKGNVLFDLEFSVEPDFVDYEKNLLLGAGNSLGANSDNSGNLNNL